MENNINKSLAPFEVIKNDSPATIADQKINDGFILLSKKIDETIEKNKNNKKRIFDKADFIENRYLWEIEDLEAKLNKQINKINIALKNSLKKISAEGITEANNTQKNSDIDLLKGQNQNLLDRIEKRALEKNKQAQIDALMRKEASDIEKIEKHYAKLTAEDIRGANASEAKAKESEAAGKIKALQSAFEAKKKELLALDSQTKNQRLNEANGLRKSFQFRFLDTENLTNIQCAINNEYIASLKVYESARNSLNKEIDRLSKDKSNTQFKIVEKLEKEVHELENKKITKSAPVKSSEQQTLSKLRLAKINEGIKNGVNVVAEFVDQKMLPDLAPSFHTYKINPLLKPNNTYFAHKFSGWYKGIKYTSALVGLGIGILLMVLYTLFSIQSSSAWINVSVEKMDQTIQPIFNENISYLFATLYESWGLSSSYWNAILTIGIIVLIFSAFSISFRNHTIWSYSSISGLVVFLIIGLSLMIDVMVKMDFGQSWTNNEKLLIMTSFRGLVTGVQGFPGNATNEAWYNGLIESFTDLIQEVTGDETWKPDLKPIDW